MTNESDHADGSDDPVRESHRARAARMRAIAALANTLIGLHPSQLRAASLPVELGEAVRLCRGFTKQARARQLRRIGALLRASDLVAIEAAVQEIQTGGGERSWRERSYEHWRTQLLEGGDATMAGFVAANPGADVQTLRQRVRVARREPESPRGKSAARELLRSIRALGEAAFAPGDSPAEDSPVPGDSKT